MNQLCRVCGEPAAGFHFGAFTCEGCKSFFGRSYNNISSISECKNNGECVINKKNRTACKACRLRKCLLVGMSKSGSRYGRRSNWFKIHCLLQQQHQAGAGIGSSAGLLRPHPYLPQFSNSSSAVDTKSSESDSGASSADPEDDLRSASAFSYFGSTISPPSDRSSVSSKNVPSSASESALFAQKLLTGTVSSLPPLLPSMSGNNILPTWFSPLQGFANPSTWRDLWIQAPMPVAAPAPEQESPIDLSVRTPNSPTAKTNHDQELIDVGVEEPTKALPLDLTLDNTNAVTN